MKLNFRNVFALITTLLIFGLVYGIGAGLLSFASEMVQGIIIGGVMQWGAWIYMFYFRKKGPAEESGNEGANK